MLDYMDVDMDVDMNEPLASSNVTEDSSSQLPEKWFKQKNDRISFFVNAVSNEYRKW